jgi:regulatory protein
LNEERFASVFSTSKFHQKKWGKIRIKNELKSRRISDYLINIALKKIPSEEYYNTFQILADRLWETITEKNTLKKRKKFCDSLLRKGWESDLIYEKVKELER